MSDWVIGVDLGATKTAVGLINPQNEIVAKCRFPTCVDTGPEVAVECIAERVAELEKELPDKHSIVSLGICCPGPLDQVTGTLIDPPNLPTFHHTPLRQMLSDRLKLPVNMEHDAKAAALGEYYYGAARNESSMVYIVVGTGVGGAIIMDGQIIRGTHNSAGEIGHMTLDRNGEICMCGSRGCVETYMSGPWLARRYQSRAGGSSEELLSITGQAVVQRATQGDPIAQEIMRSAGEALGTAIASIAMMLDIEVYIIGGSVAKAGPIFLEPAQHTVPKYSFKSVGSRVHIMAAALGDDGPILGCGWLARQVR